MKKFDDDGPFVEMPSFRQARDLMYLLSANHYENPDGALFSVHICKGKFIVGPRCIDSGGDSLAMGVPCVSPKLPAPTPKYFYFNSEENGWRRVDIISFVEKLRAHRRKYQS